MEYHKLQKLVDFLFDEGWIFVAMINYDTIVARNLSSELEVATYTCENWYRAVWLFLLSCAHVA